MFRCLATEKVIRSTGYTYVISPKDPTQLLILAGSYLCGVRLTTKRISERRAGPESDRFGSELATKNERGRLTATGQAPQSSNSRSESRRGSRPRSAPAPKASTTGLIRTKPPLHSNHAEGPLPRPPSLVNFQRAEVVRRAPTPPRAADSGVAD